MRHFGYEEKNWSGIFGRCEALASLTGMVAAYIGATVSNVDLRYPWFLSSAGYLILGTISTLIMKEEYFQKRSYSIKEGFARIISVTRNGINTARSNKVVLFLFVIGILQFVCLQAPNMQWQPLFLPFFGNKAALGVVWAAVSLMIVLGSFLAPKLLQRIRDEKKCLMWVQIWIGLGIIISVLCRSIFLMMPAFLFHELTRGMFKPIKDSYLHGNIGDEGARATVSSFESLSRHIGAITGLLLSGLIAQMGSIRLAWTISGLVLIIGTLMIARSVKK
jgi:hypothetical protein